MNQQLLLDLRSGEPKAFESILDEFRPMIFHIINVQDNDYGDYAYDKDDMFQIASIALYEACEKYDEQRGMNFSSFVYLVIHSRIITFKKNCARTYSNEYYSLDVIDNTFVSHIDRVSDSAYEYHKEKEFENELRMFISKLPLLDQQILKLKEENLTHKEIAERLNIPCKKVANRILGIKKKYKKEVNCIW